MRALCGEWAELSPLSPGVATPSPQVSENRSSGARLRAHRHANQVNDMAAPPLPPHLLVAFGVRLALTGDPVAAARAVGRGAKWGRQQVEHPDIKAALATAKPEPTAARERHPVTSKAPPPRDWNDLYERSLAVLAE